MRENFKCHMETQQIPSLPEADKEKKMSDSFGFF